MPGSHVLRDKCQRLFISFISFGLFAACSSAPPQKKVSEASERKPYLLAEDPSLSEEEWQSKAIALALTGGVKMVQEICTEDQKAYACEFLAASCENGNKDNCKTLAAIGFQDERYKYYRMACGFEDSESCQLLKDMEPKKRRGPASDETVEMSTAEALDNWNHGAIDRYISSSGGAPARIITMGSGKTLYEFVESQGVTTAAEILEPTKCTIQLFVENGRIYSWKLRGNTGSCLN